MQTEEFVRNIYRGSVKNLISALFDGNGLSKKDIAELRQFIREKGE